jgi:hypothetical protein
MEYIISNAEIENTQAFKKLENCFKNIALKLTSKKIISAGLLVHKNSGIIPGSVSGNNLKILKDLIETQKQQEHDSI